MKSSRRKLEGIETIQRSNAYVCLRPSKFNTIWRLFAAKDRMGDVYVYICRYVWMDGWMDVCMYCRYVLCVYMFVCIWAIIRETGRGRMDEQ